MLLFTFDTLYPGPLSTKDTAKVKKQLKTESYNLSEVAGNKH
jgi:hypothetical protein